MWTYVARAAVRRLGLAIGLLVAWQAAAQPAAIRIAVLSNREGDVLAVRMAVRDAGGAIGGRSIVVTQVGADPATPLDADRVNAAFDGGTDLVIASGDWAMSLSAAVQAKARHRLVIVTGAPVPELTRGACGKYVYRYGPDVVALAAVSGAWLSMDVDGRRWAALVEESPAGRASLAAFVPEILARHGEVMKRIPFSSRQTDFGTVTAELQTLKPGVVGVFGDGPGAADAIAQVGAADLPAFVGASSPQAFDVDRQPEDFVGMRGAVAWVWTQDTDSRAWAARFATESGGVWPGAVQAASYSATTTWLHGVQATGGTDADAVAAYLDDRPVMDMFAHGARLRARDHALTQDLFMVEAVAAGAAPEPHAYLRVLGRVPAETAFPPASADGCPKAW